MKLENRVEFFSFRLTKKEKNMIKKEARYKGKRTGDFVRFTVLQEIEKRNNFKDKPKSSVFTGGK